MPNALLDFWHSDEHGAYDNRGFRYRGHQFADAQGRYRLETIVPAEYPGRTRHIHVKVQAPGGRILTTQLYFPGDPGNKRDGLYRQELEVKKLKGDEAGFDFVVWNSGSEPEFLAPAVVPGVAGVAVAQGAAAEEQQLQQEAEELARGVELPLRSLVTQRMAMQDDELRGRRGARGASGGETGRSPRRRRAPR